jgi:hypothetical protein
MKKIQKRKPHATGVIINLFNIGTTKPATFINELGKLCKKDKRWVNMHKSIHREILKAEGKIHLPPNKAETPKNAYKRKKFRKSDLLKLNTD